MTILFLINYKVSLFSGWAITKYYSISGCLTYC